MNENDQKNVTALTGTIATALGGPLAGVLATLVGSLLIRHLSGDQLNADEQLVLKELKVRLAAMATDNDKADAEAQMEIETYKDEKVLPL